MIGRGYAGRPTQLAIAGILSLGVVFLWINLDLPIVRNAEAYAQAAYSLLDAGLDPRPVIADPELSCGKPIGFPLLSVPWVRLFGGNGGLMIASFLGTALFLVVSGALMARLDAILGIAPDALPLQILLLWFNPLLIYQFWSAYPDTLLGALSLAVLLLVDDAAAGGRRTLWTSIVVSLILVASVLIKYFGVVLLLMLPLAYLCHRERLRPGAFRNLWLAIGLLPPVLFVAAGALGLNPLLEPSGKGGGTEQYLGTIGDPRILLYRMKNSLISFLFAVGLAFNVLLVLFVAKFDYRSIVRDRRRLFFALAASGLLLALLPFPGTSYNIRYFVSFLPFLAVPLAPRLLALRAPVRYALLATFLSIQIVLILGFNVRTLHESWSALDRAVPHQWENLRMRAHVERRAALDLFDRDLAPGAVVFLWSDYYEGCANGSRERLWRQMGVDPDHEIEFRAVPAFTQGDVAGGYYVWVDKLRLDDRLREVTAADLDDVLPGTVTAMGHGLFRVDPPSPGGEPARD